eukprot:14368028-Alexandrium_andersonii.AAC.1
MTPLSGVEGELLVDGMHWPRARQEQRIARIADWGIADWSLHVSDFATSDPLEARLRWPIR